MTFAIELRDLINKYSDSVDPQVILGGLAEAYDPTAFAAIIDKRNADATAAALEAQKPAEQQQEDAANNNADHEGGDEESEEDESDDEVE